MIRNICTYHLMHTYINVVSQKKNKVCFKEEKNELMSLEKNK